MKIEHIICAALVMFCAVVLEIFWIGAHTEALTDNSVDREVILQKMIEAKGPVTGFSGLTLSDRTWVCRNLPGVVPFFEGETLCAERLEKRMRFLVEQGIKK